jgi:hypothetical protein
VESGELVQAQGKQVSNELQLSGMRMPPPDEHDGASYTAYRPPQIAKPQSFALRHGARIPMGVGHKVMMMDRVTMAGSGRYPCHALSVGNFRSSIAPTRSEKHVRSPR